jgi:predicted metalloprotease with PDZ domain
MRIAYERYGGERGFTADELRAVVEQVAGRGVKAWWAKAIDSPGELEYGEMLAWYGLRFVPSTAARKGGGAAGSWALEVRPGATAAQKKRLQALLTSSGPVRPARPRR